MKLLAEGLWIFVLFSFLGWTAHCVWQSVKEKRPLNVGFLTLPFMPTIGTGFVLLFVFLSRYENQDLKEKNTELEEKIRQYEDWVRRLHEFMELPEDQRSDAFKTYCEEMKRSQEFHDLTNVYLNMFNRLFIFVLLIFFASSSVSIILTFIVFPLQKYLKFPYHHP